MNWRKVGEVAGKALPLVGTLLAGPAGGTVGAMVAQAIGVQNDPDAVMGALADPAKQAELRRWAMTHQENLERLALETLQAELSDKANARTAHRHSPMPAIVTTALTAIVAGLLYLLFRIELPDANQEVAYLLFGQASALWAASVTYWVGTTRSSADKTRMMGRP
jgi:hypothetical protein